MAHELKFNDSGKAAMFAVGKKPWHGQGVMLHAPPTAAEAIRAASLDWEVVKAPLFYHTSSTQHALASKKFALVPGEGWRDKVSPLFGTVTEKYTILQNRDAFAFFDPVVRRGYATYETAGALGKGERVWVLAKLPEPFDVGTGDPIERYILLSNTHDGHGTVKVKFTPVRVVCQNTLSIALNDAEDFFAIRHDGDMFTNLGTVADEMRDRIEARYAQIAGDFLQLRQMRIDPEQAEAYFAAVYPAPIGPPPQDGTLKRLHTERVRLAKRDRAGCLQVYNESEHCRLGGETLWTAYNAVTEYVDHWLPAASRGRNPAVQLNRIWFGEGQRRKLLAFDEAMRLTGNPPF